MKINHCTLPRVPRKAFAANSRGFSLIEAMIAIVVLVVGILALTVLQIAMVRSGAGARDRTVAVTVGQNVVEDQRAAALVSPASYASLAPQGAFVGGVCDFANGLTPVTGQPVDYRYCVRVERFRANAGGTNFVATAISAPYDAITAEYKRIFVDMGWRGPDGTWSSISLGDVISGIPLANSSDLLNRPVGGDGGVGGPQVKYDLATLTSNTNFIPIAVGDTANTQLAATNPTPKVIGGGVAETSYQVYTYFANSNLANVQRQLDTRVIGCRCTSRNASNPDVAAATTEGFLLRPLRPAYWEGARYSDPKQGAYWPVGTTTVLLGAPKANVSQSEFCDVCCRDHHDPSTVTFTGADSTDPSDDLPKFDPFRSTHSHYTDATNSGAIVSAVNQDYSEVCRLIRTDGIYRVTADPYIEHFAFIPTDSNLTRHTVVDVTPGYQAFVREYINRRIILPIASYVWGTNAVGDATAVKALESSITVGSTTYNLNAQAGTAASPAFVAINEPDLRYLQNRAILIDALEYDARQTIADSAGCGNDANGNPRSALSCGLPYVPFSSINLTELSTWTTAVVSPALVSPIAVSPLNFSSTTPTGAPVAGRVTDASGAVINAQGNVINSIFRSIATLADRAMVFYRASTDTLWPASDQQGFQYVGGTRLSYKITVALGNSLGYFTPSSGDSAAPYVGWYRGTDPTSSSAAHGDCFRTAGTTSFSCDLGSATNLVDVHLRLLNYYETIIPSSSVVLCPVPGRDVRGKRPTCGINNIVGVTGLIAIPAADIVQSPSGQPTASAPARDETRVTLGTVADGQVYNIDFDSYADLVSPNTCPLNVPTFVFTACRQ